MPKMIRALAVPVLLAAAGCDSNNSTRDLGINSHPLTELQAGIWIDPNGCDHWIIDDGIEGYMSQRLDRYGRPVCSGVGEPGTAVWDYRAGSPVPEVLF